MPRRLAITCLICVMPVPAQAQAPASNPSRQCSMDALPEAEKQRMVTEYARRISADGKPSADVWAQEQADNFRMKLVAEGVCPPLQGTGRRPAPSVNQAGKKQLLNKQGKPCKKIGVENQVSPGFGGEPMTLGLVPVCED